MNHENAPANRSKAIESIKLLLDNNAMLCDIASQSYIHQLGFLKIPISVGIQKFRLHYWPHEIIHGGDDIHTHTANFTSTLLSGEFTHQKFMQTPGNTHTKHTYYVNPKTGSSSLVAGKSTGVMETSRKKITKGSTYSLDRSTLHKISNIAEGTSTISFWENRTHQAYVIKEKGEPLHDCYKTPGINPDELRHYLILLSGIINDS